MPTMLQRLRELLRPERRHHYHTVTLEGFAVYDQDCFRGFILEDLPTLPPHWSRVPARGTLTLKRQP